MYSAEAEAFSNALQGEGVSGLIADHALRQHAFPLFVLTVLFLGLYVAYNIVGDPVVKLLKVCALVWAKTIGSEGSRATV